MPSSRKRKLDQLDASQNVTNPAKKRKIDEMVESNGIPKRFSNAKDQKQFEEIVNAVEDSPAVTQSKISKDSSCILAQFATGILKVRANKKCQQEIWILNEHQDIDGLIKDTAWFKYCSKSDSYFCESCKGDTKIHKSDQYCKYQYHLIHPSFKAVCPMCKNRVLVGCVCDNNRWCPGGGKKCSACSRFYDGKYL